MNVPMEKSQNPTGNTMWRTDTKSLVGAVILGIVFILIEQIAGRIDAMLWPTLVIIDGIVWATFTGLITLIYRQPGGIIMTELQAFLAIATGQAAFAIFFIPANAAGTLVYSLVAWKLSMEKWSHHLLAQLLTNVAGNIFVGLGLYFILHLPLPIVLISSAITCTAGTIGATILTKVLHDSLKRSGLV